MVSMLCVRHRIIYSWTPFIYGDVFSICQTHYSIRTSHCFRLRALSKSNWWRRRGPWIPPLCFTLHQLFSRISPSRESGKFKTSFPSRRNKLDHPDYPAWARKATGLRSWRANSQCRISNDRSQLQEKVREVCHNLAHANFKKEVFYDANAIPDCIEGAWTARHWIQEKGGRCKVHYLNDVY